MGNHFPTRNTIVLFHIDLLIFSLYHLYTNKYTISNHLPNTNLPILFVFKKQYNFIWLKIKQSESERKLLCINKVVILLSQYPIISHLNSTP